MVLDRRAAVLVQITDRTESKCRSLSLKSIKAGRRRLDSTVVMTQHRSSPSFVATPMAPSIITALIRSFFTAPVWDHVLAIVAGMTLAPGKRTVSAALRVVGLGEARDFACTLARHRAPLPSRSMQNAAVFQIARVISHALGRRRQSNR